MAQPKNTIYEIRAAMPDGTMHGVMHKTTSSWSRTIGPIELKPIGEGMLKYGFADAKYVVKNLQKKARTTYKKGNRPRYFLKRIKVSEVVQKSNSSELYNSTWFKARFEEHQLAPFKTYARVLHGK